MTAGRRGVPERAGEESGSVAVIVAFFMVVLLAAAALSADLGAGWASKRALATDLDAAALAGALVMAQSENYPCDPGENADDIDVPVGTRAEISHVLAANQVPGGTVDEPTFSCIDGVATVRLEGERQAPRLFSTSQDDVVATGYTMAQASRELGGRVLPLTLCWNEPPFPAAGAETTIEFDTPACGPDEDFGAWGWLGPDADTIGASLVDPGFGQDATISTDPDDLACQIGGSEGTEDGWCVGSAIDGSAAPDPPLLETLEDLVCTDLVAANCPVYTVVVHDDAILPGPATASFRPSGFVDVIIRDVSYDPPEPEEPEDPADPEDPEEPTDPQDPDPEDPEEPTDPQDPDPEDPEEPAEPASITLQFLAPYRFGPNAELIRGPSSYLCSVDGAPDDSGCRANGPP